MGKREDIRDAALDIISEEGMRGLTLPRLFERASTGSGTFYHYYRDRDDLLDTLFLHCFDVVAQELDSADDESLTYPERLERFLICTFGVCEAYPREFSFLYWGSCGYTGLETECCRLSPFSLMLTRLLSQARESGEMTVDFSPVLVAHMIYGMVESALWGHRNGLNALDEVTAARFSRCVWSGLV